ncbi:MAG TPA: SCO1664 family protein [Mycobacteriales bacterium]|nr:SCO1664 family protein [Mycobacteriales bacterium]
MPPEQGGEHTAPDDVVLDLPAALDLLRRGELTVEGRLVDASNATLYCTVAHQDLRTGCVYKPVRGERPLWDFPDGTLAGREAAAYLVSQVTGWNIVPPTVLRDGPFGPGMVQLWIDGDESVDLRRLVRGGTAPLRRMAVFDAVVNNADRKGGHLIPLPDGHVYGVDHGVCFSAEPKLRTVLWGWAGQALTDEAIDVLSVLRAELEGPLGKGLGDLLTTRELAATVRRVDLLLTAGRHPEPSGDWPAVPWPPF